MKNNITELVFILDRSGSMSGMEKDTIGGFNSMIEKQKKLDGQGYVTTVLFNNTNKTIHDRIDLKEVKPLTEDDYQVGGCTALLDAIGTSIKHIEQIHKYIRKEDVPENTIFVITTDGYENASNQYTSQTVKKLIEKKKEEGCQFIFMAANIDALETAASFGIDKDHATNYYQDSMGTKLSFMAANKAMTSVRTCGDFSVDWNEDVEAHYKKNK